MLGLTPKALELKLYISDHIIANGCPPSYDEMRIAMQLKSKAGIHRMIGQLERRGHVRFGFTLAGKRRPRSLEIVDRYTLCPHCGNRIGSAKCVAAANANITYSKTPYPAASPMVRETNPLAPAMGTSSAEVE